MRFEIKQLDDIPRVAAAFLKAIKPHKIFAFHGNMGVGKTTFISGLMHQMQIDDHVSSPTFSIVNEYYSNQYGKVYHFDFYRIEDEEEAYQIGVEEIFDEDAYCFIEWPERIDNLLPPDCVSVYIDLENDARIIQVDI